MKKLSPLFVSLLASIAVLFLFGATVHADISLNGELRVDTSYTANSQDNPGSSSTDNTVYDQTGRVKLIPSIRKEAGTLYLEAKAEMMANQDGDATVDDAWGKIGTSSFDVQLGRFEAWDLFPKSNDMLIVDAPGGPGRYEANSARGRIDSAGQFALHAFAGEAFGMELGLVYGQDGSYGINDSTSLDANLLGVRPVINAKFGNFEFAAGADMLSATSKDDSPAAGDDHEQTKTGFGAKAKAVFGIATMGFNYASGTVENTVASVDQPDETTNSLGAYVDLAVGDGVLTFAGFMTNWESDNPAEYDEEHTQYFIAYSNPLPFEGASINFAVSQASASDDDPTVGDSDALGFKVRLQYDF
jgi:hypothetical protein